MGCICPKESPRPQLATLTENISSFNRHNASNGLANNTALCYFVSTVPRIFTLQSKWSHVEITIRLFRPDNGHVSYSGCAG